MRVVAEYIENTTQLLLRFLSVPAIPNDTIQLGVYAIDGTPQLPCVIRVDIDSDSIKEGEAHTSIVGYWPLPKWLDVTLPDLTTQRVEVVKVIQYASNYEPLLIEQPIDVIVPIEPEPRRPDEGFNPYKPIETLPPEYPDVYVELALERTDPIRLGANITSDSLTYVGGCAGRALTATITQKQTDAAPYLSYAPVRLEGQFTNSLFNSNFSLSPTWPTPHFDPLPNGWQVLLADPLSIVRMQTTEASAALPSFTLRYRQRTGSDVSTIPPVTILTPPLTNAGETFQVIVVPSSNNVAGRLQLRTYDDAVVSPSYTLVSGIPVIAHLAIGTHTGAVKIVWDQQKGAGEEQIIQLIGPSSSVYTGSHSYIPTGSTSFSDVLTLNNIEFNKPWYFYRGSIRVDGSGDNPAQPFSWKVQIGNQILLQVDGGLLSSDFQLQPAVNLSSYLLSSVTSYKLTWASPTEFKLTDASGLNSIVIPFSFDIGAIADTTSSLKVVLTGYKPNEGSSIGKRWVYSPT